MFDYRGELERRIAQIGSYLRPMNHRAHEIAHGDCFIIFEERRPGGESGQALVEKNALSLQAVANAFGQLGVMESADSGDEAIDLPHEGWREDDSRNRYIQFAIGNKWFCMDMPLETLRRAEAEEILRYRNGFFYLRDRTQFTLHQEDVEGHDPFRKVYVYGDEDSAAEDMAFIFFQVWKFPVDSRFYVTAASFSGKHEWEKGFPIE
jgi:hypothetical protein